MPKQSNKNRPKFVSQKIYRNQNTLGSATINPCHPNIRLMTEQKLRDTFLKKIAKKREHTNGGLTAHPSPLCRFLRTLHLPAGYAPGFKL